MTKIDIVSGFLGAGKTTLIQKMLKEAFPGEKVVLIENEFGEIGIDGGFLQQAGIEIKEMNSGCICCSLVGDFGTSLKEVLESYAPDRILIEPSGVGKLSDVMKAVYDVTGQLDVQLNSAVVVVDVTKCKMYIKNFGEFFLNQVENAGTIILSRTGKADEEKVKAAVALLREHNTEAKIITTEWSILEGKTILETIENADDFTQILLRQVEEAHHHDDDEEEEHEHCHHHHDDENEEEHEHCHHHHDDENEEEHEHCHHHHDEENEEEHEHCCHHHHDDDEEEEHEHCHHHHDDEEEDEHEHHHEHDENCTCGCHDHHHGHHHADEVFTSWGMETPKKYSEEEIKQILEALEDEAKYGYILRSKGMVPGKDGEWIYFDYVPGEEDVRKGTAQVTGKICVIGSKMNEKALAELFA